MTSARIDELRKKFDENPRRYFAPLANEYRKAGDLEQAVFICEEYLPQQPGHMSGHIVYGQALFELGRFDDARGVFETALSLDPENLIALRHLGDVARQAGDSHSARVWYQRVLEADPRNEEIAQLMGALLATPASTAAVDNGAATPLSNPVASAVTDARESTPSAQAQPAEEETATPPTETPGAATPSMTALPSKPGESTPIPSTPVESTPVESTPVEFTPIEFTAVEFTAAEFTPVQSTPVQSSPVPPTPSSSPSFVSRHAPKEDELLDLDTFDLGGVPLGSLRNAEAEPAVEPATATSSSEMADLEAVGGEMNGEDEEFVEKSYDTFEPGAPDRPSSVNAAADVEIEKAQEITAADFENDPYAIAANPLTDGQATSFTEDPPGAIELAADIALGLPEDRSPMLETPESSLKGLETFDAGILAGNASPTSSAEALTTDSFFDISEEPAAASSVVDEAIADESLNTSVLEREPAVEVPAFAAVEPIAEAAVAPEAETEFAHDPSTSAPGFSAAPSIEPEQDTPAFEQSIGAMDDVDVIASSDAAEGAAHVPAGAVNEAPGAFVTETMATLYLEQGHYDAALDIYRQLVHQRPDDIALRDRLHAAEERAWGHHQAIGAQLFDADSGAELDDVAPAPRSYGGPTIRDFLTGILFRRNLAVEEAPPSVDEQPVAGLDVSAEQTESELSDASAMRPSVTPPTGDSLTRSLGALFSEADAAAPTTERPSESTFDAPVAPPTTGTPAHRASNELSLDHVFKANSARPESNRAFSFDQFFSEEAGEQPSPSPEPATEPHSDSDDDIAQFNAWLSGLKKP
jgi:tetratricopeptide (TPR) repeat protein